MTITPKDWGSFQHYKNRAPAWIKLHRGLLDNYDFSRLPVASRALAPMLWLLASEYDDGKITASFEEIAFRFRTTVAELTEALTPLFEKGFFKSDETIAACYQTASTALAECLPREEEEEEEEREEEERSADAPPDKIVSFRRHVFEGRIIRLDQAGFDRWKQTYHAIPDLPAVLQSADDYYSEHPPKDGKWFFPVSRWLLKEHDRITAEKETRRKSQWAF